jgi:hypothetical protein
MPITEAGRVVTEASLVIEIELVFVARIALGFRISPYCFKRLILTASSSTTASMRKSTFAMSLGLLVVVIRARTLSRSSVVIRSFFISLSSKD